MQSTHSFLVAGNGLSQVRGLHQCPLTISWALWVRNPGTGSARCPGEVSVSAGRIPFWNSVLFPSSSYGQRSALCNWGMETPVLSLAGATLSPRSCLSSVSSHSLHIPSRFQSPLSSVSNLYPWFKGLMWLGRAYPDNLLFDYLRAHWLVNWVISEKYLRS